MIDRTAIATIALTTAAGSLLSGLAGLDSAPGTPSRIEPEVVQIRVGAFVFDALAQGPEDGPLVLLLHGFPETSFAFRHQLQALADAGYRAVAPDQRGYSAGARPTDVESYRLGRIAEDVIGIADALERRRFHLVGHDWGAAVAWFAAGRYPDRIASLTAISTPHPLAFGAALADPDGDQAARSAYFAEFGAPGAEERFLADDAARLRRVYGGVLTAEEIDRHLRVLGSPDALRAALNWYRALSLPPAGDSGGPPKPVAVPTLYVWSTADPAFGRAAAEATATYVTGPYRFEVFDGVSHWIPEEVPDRLNESILSHLRGATTIDEPTVSTLETSVELQSSGRLGGVSVDATGNVYVANFHDTVWRIAPDGETAVLSATLQGSSGNAVDADGYLLQGSWVDNRVVRIGPDGSSTTYAEGFDGPVGIAVGNDGGVYVCNCRSNEISRVDSTGAVARFATHADFDCPNGITVDENGDVYVVSFNNGYLVRVSPDGVAERLVEIPEGKNAHIARIGDYFYVTKIEAHAIYRVSRSGHVTRSVGRGTPGMEDGPASAATLAYPNGIAAGPDGVTLYVNTLEGTWRGDEPTRIVIRRVHLPTP